MTDVPPRPDTHVLCRCGKRGWLGQDAAEAVVIRAKIMRYLHANNQRREQRTYRCTTDPTLWHVTSTSPFDPTRAPRQNIAVREYVEALLLEEHQSDTEPHWKKLIDAGFHEPTMNALADIHQGGLRHGANLKARRDEMSRRRLAGEVGWEAFDREADLYREWVLHWARFQAVIVARKTQFRNATRRSNIARASDENWVLNSAHRHAAAELALAIHRHRRDTTDPTDADWQLWHALEAVEVPYGRMPGQMKSVGAMVAEGRWTEQAASDVGPKETP
jgi:hypothetical protein